MSDEIIIPQGANADPIVVPVFSGTTTVAHLDNGPMDDAPPTGDGAVTVVVDHQVAQLPAGADPGVDVAEWAREPDTTAVDTVDVETTEVEPETVTTKAPRKPRAQRGGK